MSARDLRIPNRAMHQMITDMQRRLAILEHRARWHGSVRFEDYANSAYDVPQLGEPERDIVATYTVDPGRWVFIAHHAIELLNTPSPAVDGNMVHSIDLEVDGAIQSTGYGEWFIPDRTITPDDPALFTSPTVIASCSATSASPIDIEVGFRRSLKFSAGGTPMASVGVIDGSFIAIPL